MAALCLKDWQGKLPDSCEIFNPWLELKDDAEALLKAWPLWASQSSPGLALCMFIRA